MDYQMQEVHVSLVRNIAIFIGASLAIGSISTAAIAQSVSTETVAGQDVRELLQLMDKDKSGAVSKAEFLDFMSQTFDRLDVNRSGQLESEELRPLTKPNWVPCSTAARETDGTYTCIGIPPGKERK
jgi:Ca2+-binding EF-hand superfamily protein